MDELSDELLGKLSKDDIGIILDSKFEYLESINMVQDIEEPYYCTYTADID